MLGLKTKTVKARRALKKLDKKANAEGVLGVTGNVYVQTKERLKDRAITPAFTESSYKGDHYVS